MYTLNVYYLNMYKLKTTLKSITELLMVTLGLDGLK